MSLTTGTETKPGVYTTEFWVSIFTGLYMVLNTTGVLAQIPDRYASVGLAIVSAAYALSRGQAKSSVKPG